MGLLCRETLVSLAQAGYDTERHPPPDGKSPKRADAGRMLDAYMAAELAGGPNEEARRHAKAALSLALALQHRRTADFRDAAMCAEATTSVVNLIAIVDGKRFAGDIPALAMAEKQGARRRESDRRLFAELKADLPSKGSISFIDEWNMAGFGFDWKKLDQLEAFHFKWGDAEHEFIDSELERQRRTLHELVGRYLSYLALNSRPRHTGLQTIPPEWEHEQPKRFDEVVTTLHDLARQIVAPHQELVRSGRIRLEG